MLKAGLPQVLGKKKIMPLLSLEKDTSQLANQSFSNSLSMPEIRLYNSVLNEVPVSTWDMLLFAASNIAPTIGMHLQF